MICAAWSLNHLFHAPMPALLRTYSESIWMTPLKEGCARRREQEQEARMSPREALREDTAQLTGEVAGRPVDTRLGDQLSQAHGAGSSRPPTCTASGSTCRTSPARITRAPTARSA